ncbi:protein LATE ELONGATED HYPOCOTYL isoform X2 [Silene latifolia]
MPPCSSHHTEQGINLEKEPIPEKHVCDDGEKIREGTCEGDKCSEAVTSLGVTRERPDKPDSIEITQYDTKNEMHAAKTFPRHARVQILDGSSGTCSQGLSSDVSYQEPKPQTEFVGHPASSPINQQMYPTFHPSYNPFPNHHGDYSSFLQMSSTFSSLILSALLQNPAAYAAASSAASLWPNPIVENSVNSPEVNNAGFGPGPSMAAIAAATVAAATAWWAAHGLLPLTAPFPAGFPSFGNVGQTSVANEEKEENFKIPGSQVQQPEQEHSKSSETSSSNSGNSVEVIDVGERANDAVEVPVTSEQKDTNEVTKKQVDRSSCGSNTPSGSDAETDVLGKDGKGNEESKEPDENRRIRFLGNTNDNWKEVSEEGRLAFKALFSKGRLPQSFSRRQHLAVEDLTQNTEQRIEEALQLDLNSIPWKTASGDQSLGKIGSHCLGNNNNTKEGPSTIGFIEAKTSSGTGFKPYKRCSVEARESGMTNSSNQEEGNCSKRLRLEGESSI